MATSSRSTRGIDEPLGLGIDRLEPVGIHRSDLRRVERVEPAQELPPQRKACFPYCWPAPSRRAPPAVTRPEPHRLQGSGDLQPVARVYRAQWASALTGFNVATIFHPALHPQFSTEALHLGHGPLPVPGSHPEVRRGMGPIIVEVSGEEFDSNLTVSTCSAAASRSSGCAKTATDSSTSRTE